MLNLENYLSHVQSLQRNLLLQVLDHKGKDLFKDTLFLSFLGARICYSSSSPLALFQEERFKEPEKLLAFLMRLKKAGHASIFAHSPLVISTQEFEETKLCSLARFLYKAWWDPEEKHLCLNLRHWAEIISEELFYEILVSSLQASDKWKDFLCLEIGFKEEGEAFLKSKKTLGEVIYSQNAEKKSLSPWAENRVFVIDTAPQETKPFGWLAVLVEGFSRLFSHQFVRHTWLNFNQRSHRYTALDEFVLPPSLKKASGKSLYEEVIKQSMKNYDYLIDKKQIKKEDARFLTPQGASTSLIATGPYFVWEDFIAKRAHAKAQWEIRRLAWAIKKAKEEIEQGG